MTTHRQELPSPLRLCLLALALVAVLSHSLHAWHLINRPMSGPPAFHMYDTLSYLGDARALQAGEPMSPAFQDRPLLPCLIAFFSTFHLPVWTVLFVPILLQGFLVYAIGFIAFFMSGRAAVAGLAACLTAIYPNFYCSIPQLGTDAMGTQFMMLAIAAGLRWRNDSRRIWGFLCGLLWLCAQATRPTFMPIAALMPFLLWPLWQDKNRRKSLVLFMAFLTLFPLGLSVKNEILYGVPSANLTRPEMLSRCLVAKINTMKRHFENPAPLSKYWEEERDCLAFQDVDWAALKLYHPGNRDRGEFSQTYARLVNRMNEHVRQDSRWLWRGAHIPYYTLFLSRPPSFSPVQTDAPPAFWQSWGLRLDKVFLLFFLMGMPILLRRIPSIGILWGGLLFLMLAPLVVFMWLAPATRLPVDALAIPVAALALSSLRSWTLLGAWALISWLPCKLGLMPFPWCAGVGLAAITASFFWSGATCISTGLSSNKHSKPERLPCEF